MGRSSMRGTTFLEILISMALLFLLAMTITRYFSETSLPQQMMIRQFPVAMHLAEKTLNVLANEISGGKTPLPPEGETDLTASMLEHPQFLEELRVLWPGLNLNRSEISVPLRAALQVRYLAGLPMADVSGTTLPGVDGRIVNLTLHLSWGHEPSHHLYHCLSVPQP
ncbi:MAG TPA: hypothetical protein PKO06_20245 [Candidatus Ozemobacteraceae bacterium]|nr:hypothetical protein [Candidatus Ozemobacteraceae bacterium]